MDDVARYGEACTAPSIEICIFRSADITEGALQRENANMIKNTIVNNMTFEGEIIPEIILTPQRGNEHSDPTTVRAMCSSPKMAKIPTPIPQLKLNDGTSIPMLAYGSKSFTHLPHLSIVLTIPSRDCLV